MKTVFYFVRHAQPNYSNHDDMTRELSEKGLRDRALVTRFLKDKNISVALSSPYKRAFDTISEFALEAGLTIQCIDNFRERRVDSGWIEDFDEFSRRQWEDMSYKLSDGECLQEVQSRNIQALKNVLQDYGGKNIVVGSHGTALSMIINYYDKSFNYNDFCSIKNLMSWIVKLTFANDECVEIDKIDLFAV